MNPSPPVDGTPESEWEAARWHSLLPPLDLGELHRLIIVAAHPEDQTLGTGGLISRAAGLGLPIAVIVLSNGETSHADSNTHTPEQLAMIRRLEVTDAVTALAPHATVRLLGLPGGVLSEYRESVEGAIGAALGDGGPGTWVVAPWHADGHPDHAAASLAAAFAAQALNARLLEYPIWAWHWATPTSEVWPAQALRVLGLTADERSAKLRALALHLSQVHALSDDPGDEPILQPAFSAHFVRGFEIYIEAAAAPAREMVGEGARAAVPAASVSGSGPADAMEPGAAKPSGPRVTSTLGAPFFDGVHRESRDPFGVETRWYEKRKRALALAALPRERFVSALELGCSTGVFTAAIATRCDTVLATDFSEEALRIARERLAGHPGITFERRALPADWPAGSFDLIVLSEIGYYLSIVDLRRLLERCRASLAPGGVLLACHWRHRVPDYPLTGDTVHTHLAHVAGLQRTVHHQEYDFVLEIFEPRPARSVAQHDGLVP